MIMLFTRMDPIFLIPTVGKNNTFSTGSESSQNLSQIPNMLSLNSQEVQRVKGLDRFKMTVLSRRVSPTAGFKGLLGFPELKARSQKPAYSPIFTTGL